MKERVLVIGFGNIYCRDDGVGFYVVNALRKRLGLPELGPDDDGLDELGNKVDALVLHQLIPETVSVVSNYQTVVFVDAHMGAIPEEVRWMAVQEEYGFHAVTHQMSPGMLLAMTRRIQGRTPSGFLVSVKGDDFNFGLGLSDACRFRADMAVEKILDLTGEVASGKEGRRS
jgi:hydrogenase maturation protease